MTAHLSWSAALLCALSLFAGRAAHSAPADSSREAGARVETSSGPVHGSANATTVTYLGIPYAEPPVANLRWRPPQPRHSWQTVFEATRFGNRCIQSPPDLGRNESEDCLVLNVYAPKKTLRRPVIVWIHGGGNCCGAGDMYDPTPLVETGAGVVVVTLNYRLGVLGFLAHPALDSEGHAAVNYGILDQQLALKWVRTNIAHFGGDADDITLMGESAGGLNVITHIVSPLSRGLFQRAIIQSGAFRRDAASLAESEALGSAFVVRAGCANQTAACLRSLPVWQILAQTGKPRTPTVAYNPATVDTQILVETHRAALSSGRFNRVPVLQGSNSSEGRTAMPETLTQTEHEKALESSALAIAKDPIRARAIYSLERYTSAYEAASAAFVDRIACATLESNHLFSKWVPAYSYEFADSDASAFGAAHGAELKYFFNVNYESADPALLAVVEAVSGNPASLPAASQRLARQMRESWVNFAEAGRPQTQKISKWPRASESVQVLEPSLPGSISSEVFAKRHHCDFWN